MHPRPHDSVDQALAGELLRHADFVRALARRLTRDRTEAADCEQELWLRALQHRPAIAGGLRGWLARALERLVIDRRRARARREDIVARCARESRGREPTPTSVDDSWRALEQLSRAFAALPEHYRTPLFLRYHRGLAPDEIAQELGLGIETVRTRLRRGLARLRSELGAERNDRLGAALVIASLREFARPELVPRAGACESWITWMLTVNKKLLVAALVLVPLTGVAVWRARIAPTRTERAELAATPAAVMLERVVESQARSVQPRKDADAAEVALDGSARAALAAPLSTHSSFAGRIVYESTGEGVPFLSLVVASELDPRVSEALTTDRDGRFRTERAFPDKVSLSFRQAPKSASPVEPTSAAIAAESAIAGGLQDGRSIAAPQDLELRAGADPHEAREEPPAGVVRAQRVEGTSEAVVSVALGPTYLFASRSNGPAGDPWVAQLRDFDTPYQLGSVEYAEASALQRAGELLWVRLEAPVADLDELPASVRLILRSRSGRQWGEVDFPPHLGVGPVLELPTFEPRGVLTVDVQSDAPRALRAAIGLQTPTGERWSSEFVRAESGKASVQFAGVPGGAYLVFVDDNEHHPWRQSVLVRAGESTAIDALLRAQPPGGDLRGLVRSDSGQFRGPVILFLEGLGERSYWARADPEWIETPEGWIAEFAFDDLPFGRYRLRCNTTQALAIVDPTRELAPPLESVEFLVRDRAPMRTLGWDVVAAETGEALERCRVAVRIDNGYLGWSTCSSSEPCALEIAKGVPFEWRVFADGHRSVAGNESAFAAQSRVAVRLPPGFSAILSITNVEDLSKVTGVEVFADGRRLGRTDSRGEIALDLPARPARIELDPALFRVYSDAVFRSGVDPQTGELGARGEGNIVGIYVRPVK